MADGVGEQCVIYGVNLQIKEDDAVAAVLVRKPQRVDISSDLRMVVVEAVQHIVLAVADRVDDKRVEVGNHSQVKVHRAVAAVAVHKEQRVVDRAHLRLDDLEAVKQVVDAVTDCVDDILIAVGPHLKAKAHRAVAAVLIAKHYAVDAVARLWLQDVKSVVGVVIAFADGGNEVGLVGRHDGELQIREAVAAAECLKVQSVEVQADWHNRVVEAVQVVLLTFAHAVGEVVGVNRVDLQLKVHRAVAAVNRVQEQRVVVHANWRIDLREAVLDIVLVKADRVDDIRTERRPNVEVHDDSTVAAVDRLQEQRVVIMTDFRLEIFHICSRYHKVIAMTNRVIDDKIIAFIDIQMQIKNTIHAFQRMERMYFFI